GRRRLQERCMVTKTKAAQKEKEKEEAPEKEGAEAPDTPLPLLDLSDAAVKTLIRSAKKRGYVTHDQINSVLPSEEVNSEQIEDVLAMFRRWASTWSRPRRRAKREKSSARSPTKRARAASWSRCSKRSRSSPRPRSRPSART